MSGLFVGEGGGFARDEPEGHDGRIVAIHMPLVSLVALVMSIVIEDILTNIMMLPFDLPKGQLQEEDDGDES
jgi:hypothetical protein